MKKPLTSLIYVAAAALVLTGCGLATPARVAATSSHSHVNLTATDSRFGVDEAYLRANSADSLGARWSRIPFIWSYIQPIPGSWNPFALSSHGTDSVIDGELARGRDVVGLLLGTPAWARQNVAWGQASVPINIDLAWNDPHNYWGAYCYKMARHFAGRIDDWVIWNEVSIPDGQNGTAGLWTQWRGTPQQYARVLEVAYQSIHAANPGARIVMYGDPFWYDHGAYLANLYSILAHDDPTNRYHGFFDVANLHLYSNPTDFYWIIGAVRDMLRAHGWGDKQIWISETNAEPYDDPTHLAPHTNFRVSLQEQSSFLVDAFAGFIAAGVDRIEIYRMFDGVETAHGLPAWGLINNDGQLRPVGRTFHFLIAVFKGALGGSYTAGDLLDGKAGVFKIVIDKPGERITVLWNQTGVSASYHPPARDSRGAVYDSTGAATYTLTAHAARAILYDKLGNATTITPRDGAYVLHLAGGNDFTNPYDPRVPTVGGDPAIVVESSNTTS